MWIEDVDFALIEISNELIGFGNDFHSNRLVVDTTVEFIWAAKEIKPLPYIPHMKVNSPNQINRKSVVFYRKSFVSLHILLFLIYVGMIKQHC